MFLVDEAVEFLMAPSCVVEGCLLYNRVEWVMYGKEFSLYFHASLFASVSTLSLHVIMVWDPPFVL